MAEQVQAILERMVPYLKDLRDRGLFSPAEIRAIVERRRRSEYLLQRRAAARQSDYLRYIEEEVLLERLRKLRKERVLKARRNERRSAGGGASDDDDEGPRRKKKRRKHAYQTSGPGDAHVLSHVHFLYQRTLRKFHHPIDVLLSYAEFAKEHKSFQVLGRIYAEGLQHHPREGGLWIEAASFEYFGYVAQDYENGKGEDGVHAKVVGSSIRNARVLLQRGLRINRTNPELWLQYFALELHYVQKLHGRKMILEEGGSDDDGSDGDDGDAGGRMPGALLPSQVIFKNAIKAVPADVRFRLRFVEACRLFPRTAPLEEQVMASVAQDFGASVPAWVARISYAEEQCQEKAATTEEERPGEAVGFLGGAEDAEEGEEGDGAAGHPSEKAAAGSDAGSEAPDLRLLQEALAAVPTATMYLEGARFLRARIQRLLDRGAAEGEGEGEGVTYLIRKGEDAQGAAQRHTHLLEELYANADNKDISSVTLTLDRAEYLSSAGHLEQAEALLSAAADAAPSPADAHGRALLWLRWAELARQRAAEAPGSVAPPFSSPARILRRALERTPIHARRAHARILVELMRQLMTQPASPATRDELKPLFQKLVLLSPGGEYAVPRATRGTDADGEDEDDAEGAEANPAATFVAYLEHTVRHGTDDAVRSVYATVLHRSNYGATCADKTEEERRGMKAFFDVCLQFERASGSEGVASHRKKDGKDEKKARKMRLRKLYDAAMGFYESGGGVWRSVADGYQREVHDMKYSF